MQPGVTIIDVYTFPKSNASSFSKYYISVQIQEVLTSKFIFQCKSKNSSILNLSFSGNPRNDHLWIDFSVEIQEAATSEFIF